MNVDELPALLEGTQEFTILAGAGLSAPPPTCLPGWWALNDAVLGALGDALERIANKRMLSDGFRDAIRARRNTTPFLKPDLQAQLIEDELGDAYFRALGAVDSDEPNAAHALIAELAKQGRVSAVLTTNFDCIIERAFDAAGVPYRHYTSPEDFERLDGTSGPVRIIKIHGSANRPETLVDTLRQRLQGRPESLERWLHRRFVDAPTIGVGFSCDDLQYDPDYLRIRPAVRDGASFCFLVRGGKPSAPLERLVADFPNNVRISEGELPDWLFDAARVLRVSHNLAAPPSFGEDDVASRRAAAARRLDESLAAWAESIGPMASLNAATSLLAAAGVRRDADYLLRRMWEFYRAPDDCKGVAYARYLHNYGETLLRQGQLRNPYDRKTDFMAWKNAADRDPSQFFSRAVHEGGGVDSLARALLCDFLAGSPVPTLRDGLLVVLQSIAAARQSIFSRAQIDACCSVSELLELIALGRGATSLLEDAHRSAIAIGDEFRRAEAAWRLARNLAFGLGQDASAAQRVAELAAECSEIAARLDIREADAGASIALAIAAMARGDWRTASDAAREAERLFHELEDLPGEMFAKRERLRAVIGSGSVEGRITASDWDELSLSLQRFAIENAPGFRPLIKYELALLATYFDDKLALELATDAAEDAHLQQHPHLVAKASELRDALAKGS